MRSMQERNYAPESDVLRENTIHIWHFGLFALLFPAPGTTYQKTQITATEAA